MINQAINQSIKSSESDHLGSLWKDERNTEHNKNATKN